MAKCPREPGYYWAQYKKDHEWEIIKVKEPPYYTPSDAVWMIGLEYGVTFDEMEKEWDRFLGPLEPPEDET